MKNQEYERLLYGEPTSKRRSKYEPVRNRLGLAGGINADFKCAHCGHFVSADPLISGVNNRNHCPYCLWSRHMDLYQAGDRLSACKSPMRPVGLALKKSRNKYARQQDGELMLVHYCEDCGKVSLNRIAADDLPEKIVSTFKRSSQLDSLAEQGIVDAGVELLDEGDTSLVQARLYGMQVSQVLVDLD